MADIDQAKILAELESIRSGLKRGRLGNIAAGIGEKAIWGSWGSWGSSSARLPGDFSVETVLGNPDTSAQLSQAMESASSEKFLEVAKSLSDLLERK